MLYIHEQPPKTVRDLAAIPDDGNHYDRLAGAISLLPPPCTNHQDILQFFSETLGPIFRKRRMGKVLTSPVNVYATEQNVFQPNLLFVRHENLSIVKMDGIHGAPDFVIEILSPSNAYWDLK